MIKFMVISDIHFPYQDDKAIKCVLDFIKAHPVDTIILNGDILDFYDVSSFDKDPSRINSLQQEINLANKFFQKLRTLHSGKIVFIAGNHDGDRLERYLKRHPELYSLDALQIPNLLNLDKYNIEFCRDEYRLGNIKVIHGDVIRKFSGYTARAELEKHDTSGISGHSHRLSCYYYRTPERYLAWYESGCLCRLDPEYVKSPNWSQGFLYGYVDKSSFAVTPMPIVDGKIKSIFVE